MYCNFTSKSVSDLNYCNYFLSNGACPRLSMPIIVVILQRTFHVQKGPKDHKCAQIGERERERGALGPHLWKRDVRVFIENRFRSIDVITICPMVSLVKARSVQCGFWPQSSQILIWILPWIFGGGFFPPVFPGKKALKKNPPENPPQNLAGTLFGKTSPWISAEAFSW